MWGHDSGPVYGSLHSRWGDACGCYALWLSHRPAPRCWLLCPRDPCPVVAQTQNTGEAAAKSSAQSRRKTTHEARQEKARAKSEAQALPSVSKDAANGQRQAAASSRRTAANSASNLNEEIDRKESQVSAAAAAWLVGATAGDTAAQSAVGDDATAAVPVSTVQLVDPREPNELDLAADSQAP